MTVLPTLQLRVRAATWEAEGILGFELVSPTADVLLPAFDAGAHIDLHLPTGLVRSYSLTNSPGERHRFCIAVNKDPASRGGSRWLHENLRPGDVITVGHPRNNFRLNEAAPLSVFIAGGIGITPVLAMIRRLAALGQPWRLHYAARTRLNAAFVADLQGLADQGRNSAQICFDKEPGGKALDLVSLVGDLPPDSHVYCCGPLAMLDAFERASVSLPHERVHVEYFAAKDAAATEGSYCVELARSKRSITVQHGQTILDSLIAIGVEPPYSCREGVCGTCEVAVLDGVPDHRDLVLSNDEKAANTRMMICCSGSKTPTLVLDL